MCPVLLSLLALLTASSGKVPPFQLAAMCFSIAVAGLLPVLSTLILITSGVGHADGASLLPAS